MVHDPDSASAVPANRLPANKAGHARRDARLPSSIDEPETASSPRPRLELSAAQIGTGVAAAVTTAILGSTLGVAGTVVGAGVGSAISITAGAIYSHSIAATRHRWQRVHGVPGESDRRVVPGPVGSERRSDHRAVVADRPRRPDSTAGTPPVPRPRDGRWRSVLAGALGTAVAFALALVVITGVESVKGAPLAGGGQGGLSVLGGGSVGQPDDPNPVPAAPASTPPSSSTETSTDAPETFSNASQTGDSTHVTTTTTITQTVTTDRSPDQTSPAGSTRPGGSDAVATPPPSTTSTPQSSTPPPNTTEEPTTTPESPSESSPSDDLSAAPRGD